MPRLTMWLVGLTGLSATAYLGRPLISTLQQHDESIVAVGSQPMHAVVRELAGLEDYLQRATTQLIYSGGAQDGRGVLATNRQKVLFFCAIQRLKHGLSGQRERTRSRDDHAQLWRRLDQMEVEHCTELSFREERLTVMERIMCAACYLLYVANFHVLAAVVEMMAGREARNHLLHRTATTITSVLDIDCSCTTSSPNNNNNNNGVAVKMIEASSSSSSPEEKELVLCCSHWIEEVGFWACTNNPLLQSSTSDAPLRLIRSGTDASRWWMCSPTPHGVAEHFGQHWQHISKEMLAASSSDDAPSQIGTRVPFGYPLAATAPSSLSGASFIPVGVCGAPRLMDAGAARATPDEPRRANRAAVFQAIHAKQYPQLAATQAQHNTTTEMLAEPAGGGWWSSHGGLPMWSSMWWGGVHGGGQRGRRCLFYVVGDTTTAEMLTMGLLDATTQALKMEEAAAMA